MGQPVGTIGFPEELSGEAVNVPIATFRDGTIGALRPFADEVPTLANSRVIHHNLDVAGRTSGSLIIDHQGYIVGMNFAGTFRVVYDQQTGKPTRIPSENPGLALRVDELWRLYDLASGAGRIATGLPGPVRRADSRRPVRTGSRAGLSARVLQALPGRLERRDAASVRSPPDIL